MRLGPGPGWTASRAPGSSSPTQRRWVRTKDLNVNNMLDADDQMACSVIRAEGRHLSRGLQQRAPQTGAACDGVILFSSEFVFNSCPRMKHILHC